VIDDIQTPKNRERVIIANSVPQETKGKDGNAITGKIIAGNNFLRPQIKFNPPVDNTPRPFVPIITEKPNAMIPLDETILSYQKKLSMVKTGAFASLREKQANISSDIQEHISNLGIDKEKEFTTFPHPYDFEINHLEYETGSTWLSSRPPIMYPPIAETPLIWVDTVASLQELSEDLKQSQEFSVDLEVFIFFIKQNLIFFINSIIIIVHMKDLFA
jgi:hypothetical protein